MRWLAFFVAAFSTSRLILAATGGLLQGPFTPGTGHWNLVPDGDFESGFRPPWINYSSDHPGYFVDTTEKSFRGTHSAKAVPQGNYTSYGFAEYQVADLVTGQEYVVSAFFFRPDDPDLYVDMFDIPNDPELRPVVNQTDWQFVWKSFIAPPGQLGIRLVMDRAFTTNDTGYIDEVALTPVADFRPPERADSGFVDQIRPLIVLNSPLSGRAASNIVTLQGSVSDNVGIASATWELNGVDQGQLSLSNGFFFVPNVLLIRGTNSLQITAIDTSTNRSSLAVNVIYEPSRILSLAATDPFREGSIVSIPLQLESRGDVAGITFDLLFDPIFLESPTIVWSDTLQNPFVQVNTNTTGILRASFALSGTTVPAGVVMLGQIRFHARSVPEAEEVALSLIARGIVSITGAPLRDTLVNSGTVHLTKRNYIGDNNGNDRLDVGDASEIMRLVNQLATPAPWDVPANDLNGNGELDIGDVIRVLRVAAGIDRQPSVTNVQALHAFGVIANPLSAGTASLSLSSPTGEPGQKVALRANLAHLPQPISGASFVLHYPAEALRLDNPSSYRTTGLVPPGALSVWNLQNDDDTRPDGTIAFAASSATEWSGTDGAIAEFTFLVQQGATAQYLWPIQLSNLEVVSGSDLLPALNAEVFFVGREPVPPTISTSFNVAEGTVALTLSGELNAQYRLEASDDLKTWTQISVVVSEGGKANITEDVSDSAQRFYRVSMLRQEGL